MEGKESSKQWKMHLPEFEHSRRGKTDGARDREGPNKGVPTAPASRWCPTDRRYTMRRPLFSSEHYASSLKKTQPLAHTEKVRRTITVNSILSDLCIISVQSISMSNALKSDVKRGICQCVLILRNVRRYKNNSDHECAQNLPVDWGNCKQKTSQVLQHAERYISNHIASWFLN